MDYYNNLLARLQTTLLLDNNNIREGVVLYPFGKQGMLIKQILNWQYGIQEAFVIDEGLCKKNVNIKSLSYLSEIDTSKYTFIITSDNLGCWDELRKNIRKYVKEENIIDMYPYKPLRYLDPRIASLEMASREIYAKGIGGGMCRSRCIPGILCFPN